jgi:MinD-like ATPase involved in chromosome partitioning or flagellar assembly/ActR/RegA family two-component response regulator
VSETAIKLLMLEDDFQVAELVQAMLARSNAPAFAVTHVTTLAAALEKLKADHFDVVLADLTVPDSDGVNTFVALSTNAPAVPTVVLTGHEDLDLEAQILQAGAQDYLVKSHLDVHLLTKTLRCAVQRRRTRLTPAKGGRIIGFVGVKGGVGTTTVAINVAHALLGQSKSVIAAEMLPCFGTFGLELGLEPVQDLASLLEMSASTFNMQELKKSLITTSAGLRVLFSPQRIMDFKEIQADQAEIILQGLSQLADYTIVDLPPRPSGATMAAVRVCNYIGLVLEREMLSVLLARRTLEMLRGWGAAGSRVGAVIVSQVALDMPLDLREISRQLDCAILGAVPPAAEAINRARRMGSPLVVAAPENAAAVGLTEIAQRLAAETITGLRL